MLRVRLFGNPRLSFGERDLRFAGPSKCWALLAYLLLHHGERVPRRAIAFALWPDDTETAARANLRRHLHLLQKALPARIPWMLTDASTLQWNDACAYECDAVHLLDDIPEGELLPEESTEWIETERTRLRATISKRLLDSVLAHRSESRIDEALSLAHRLLEVDPFREDVVRLMMTLHVERGDKSGALALYANLDSRLKNELNASPATETAALAAAIRANDAPTMFRHNLPRYETPWIDSTDKPGQIADAMQRARLVTLAGPGGIGKTRLAVETAFAQLASFPDGVFFIDLTSVDDPDTAFHAVTEALAASGEIKNAHALARYLRGKTLLLVLDNCEHVLSGCAALAERVLEHARSVRLLATSREALGISGECVWHVPALQAEEGVQLLSSRLSAGDRLFKLGQASVESAARICRRLDGVPLALELAAACAQSLDLADLEANLDKRFTLLKRGHGHGDSRLDSLAGSLEWSFALLEPAESAGLTQLSIFAADFSFEAACALCAAPILGRLVDKSMVQFERHPAGGRYRLLETIRLYARRKLAAAAELPAHRAHAEYFRAFLESRKADWTNEHQLSWSAAVERELPNIEAALRWSFKHEPLLAVSMVCAYWRRFELASAYEEGLQLIGRALALDIPEAARAELLFGAAHLHRLLRHWETASEYFTQVSSIAEKSGDELRLSLALNGIAMSYQHTNEASMEMLRRSLELAVRCNDDRMRGLCLMNMAHRSKLLGDSAAASTCRREAFVFIHRCGDPHMFANANYAAAIEYFIAAEYLRAEQHLDRALQIWRRANFRTRIAEVLHDLGDVAAAGGELGKAQDLYAAALRRSHEIGYEGGVAQCLEGLAALFCMRGSAAIGALLLGGAERLRQLPGGIADKHFDEQRRRLERSILDSIGADAMQASLHDGATLGIDELIETALTA